MTNKEFSDEFDVLYNSITSNKAPGLDEYEKSVFLTKAQDEIIKAYFNPKSNKTQEGFDGNERRQIDFSMLIKSIKYSNFTAAPDSSINIDDAPDVINTLGELKPYITDRTPTSTLDRVKHCINPDIVDRINTNNISVSKNTLNNNITIGVFKDSFFDMRDNTKAVAIENDILMYINEYITVTRDGNITNKRLTVIPINYIEYSRLMSKPYKRPLTNQAWRLLDNNGGFKSAEIIVGPNDTIGSYVIRYIKRPRAIRLDNFEDVTLDGESTAQTCELDPILHPEILQRAVELAKAAYLGDLQSQVALGTASQTNIGMVSTASK